MTPRIILAVIGIVCAVCSLAGIGAPVLLHVAVIFIGVAVLL